MTDQLPRKGIVTISQDRWGDLQFISFPADKAAQIANAILEAGAK